MAFDNRAEFILSIGGDGSGVSAIFNAFKKQLRSDVAELEAITAKADLFASLPEKIKASASEVDRLRAAVDSLKRTLAATKESDGNIDGLTVSLKQAEAAARSAEKEFAAQIGTYRKLRTELNAAGVDTKNLAAEQQRLAAALKLATAAAVEQQQKQSLGFKTLRDIAPEVQKLTTAYVALRDSGKLSFGELGILQNKYQAEVAKLKAEVGSLGEAFNSARGSLIAFSLVFAGVISAVASATKAFLAFSTQLAAVGTIADVSEKQLAELGEGVRKLARTMGIDAVDATKALYDIIGSGVPTDNALEVLALSAKAARAGLTDVHTTAKVGVAILNAYQLKVTDLDHVFDVLFQGVKDGVITMEEFSKNIGTAIPAAVSAGVGIEQLTSAFVVLTRRGIDAPEAATAIARAIQEMSAPAPEAAAEMQALGISFDGLLGTIKQFAALNLGPDQINRLIPEVRGARAVITLTRAFEELSKTVDTLENKSAGAMQAAYNRMAETPQARIDRFNSSIKDLGISVGEFVAASSGFIERLTAMANAFNSLGPAARSAAVEIAAFLVTATALAALAKLLGPALNIIALGFQTLRPIFTAAVAGITASTLAIGALSAGFAFIVGFKIGEILREQFTPFHELGNLIGVAAGAVLQFANYIELTIVAITRLDFAKVRALWNEFAKLATTIGVELRDAWAGANEEQRKFAEAAGKAGATFKEQSTAAQAAAKDVDRAVTAIVAKLDQQAKAVEASLTKTVAALQTLAGKLGNLQSDINDQAGAALAKITADTAQKLAAITSIGVQRIRETVEVERKAAADRLQIIKALAVDTVTANEQQARITKGIAEKSQFDLAKVDQDLALQKRATLQKIVGDLQAHVITLLGIERSHLDSVRTLIEERRQANQSAEEQIRNIRRQTLTVIQQYNDKVSEIDELTSKARQALLDKDNLHAEEFAKKAIALTSGIAQEVKEGQAVVITSQTAVSQSTDRITAANDILVESLKQREAAEGKAAAAAREGIEAALPLLDRYKKELAEVTKIAGEGINVALRLVAEKVDSTLDELQGELDKRKVLAKLTLELTKANDEIQAFKVELAKDGIPLDVVPNTDKLKAAIVEIEAKHPELSVETKAAAAKIEVLGASLTKLAETKVEVDAIVGTKSVDAAQEKIDNLKKPTSSVHTVTVVRKNADGTPAAPEPDQKAAGGFAGAEPKAAGGYVGTRLRDTPSPLGLAVQRFARGGTVGRRVIPGIQYVASRALTADGGAKPLAVQRFARGGSVYRRPMWRKVPGSGDADTVPAALQAGSFVVRKAASRYYGDRLMNALAGGLGVRRFSKGGEVTKDDVNKWAAQAFGFKPFGDDGTQGPPTKEDQAGGKLLPIFGGGRDPFNIKDDAPPDSAPKQSESAQNDMHQMPFNIDGRPIPEALITAVNVITYAREMLNAVGRNNPLLGSLLPRIELGIRHVEANPNDKAQLNFLLQAAETIGANPLIFSMWEKTHLTEGADKLTPIWFLDWLMQRGMVNADGTISGGKGIGVEISEFAKNFFSGAISPAFVKAFFGDNPNKLVKRRNTTGQPQFFGRGGGTDTVPALLTPGEFVVKQRAASRYGSRLLHSINDMRMPRATLAAMLAPPRIARYADGGTVGFTVGPQSANADSGITDTGGFRAPRDITVNVALDASDLLSEANVRRKVFPVIRDMLKRSE